MKKLLVIFGVTLFSSSLLFAQSSSLWGTTETGGAMNWGTIIKSNGNGSNFHVVYSFDSTNGSKPEGNLCLANNGKLYGVTFLGGYGDSCVCFGYDTATGVYTNFYDQYLDQSQGWGAESGMINGVDGMLYGTNPIGGMHFGGTLYRIDPSTDTYTAIYHFEDSTGITPTGNLLQLSDGKLYGVTMNGGLDGFGVIFNYDPVTGDYSRLYDFAEETGYQTYYGSLVQAVNGKLYCTTSYGGSTFGTTGFSLGAGTIFSFDIGSGVYEDVFDFDSSTGFTPFGGLTRASNGLLYGMAPVGGLYNNGTIFSYDTDTDSFRVVYSFNGADGRFPKRSLTQVSNGKLFGATNYGGVSDRGTFFNFDILTNTLTTLLFCDTVTGFTPNCVIAETIAPAIAEEITPLSNSLTALSLFPSPASKEISISGNSISVNDLVTVTDVTGRQVLQQKISQPQKVNLDITALAPGVYFAEVKMQNGNAVKRFVKE